MARKQGKAIASGPPTSVGRLDRKLTPRETVLDTSTLPKPQLEAWGGWASAPQPPKQP